MGRRRFFLLDAMPLSGRVLHSAIVLLLGLGKSLGRQRQSRSSSDQRGQQCWSSLPVVLCRVAYLPAMEYIASQFTKLSLATTTNSYIPHLSSLPHLLLEHHPLIQDLRTQLRCIPSLTQAFSTGASSFPQPVLTLLLLLHTHQQHLHHHQHCGSIVPIINSSSLSQLASLLARLPSTSTPSFARPEAPSFPQHHRLARSFLRPVHTFL